MPNQHDIDIARARAALASIEAKIAQHSQGPNLTASGSPMDNRTARTAATASSRATSMRNDGAAARRSLRGQQVSSVPDLGITSDQHITGKASTYRKTWASDWGAEDLSREMVKGSAITLAPQFWAPISRPIRAATPQGVTSFHFSHSTISKVSKEVISQSGIRSRPGAAREHSRYLEREGAVAQSDREDQTRQSPDGSNATDSRALEGSDYIARQEALAVGQNGELALFTNISDDPEERREFWLLVEKHANERGLDRVTITPHANPEFWGKVRADPKCPETLRAALDATPAGQQINIAVASNTNLRKLLNRHGWRPQRRKRKGETREDYNAEVNQHEQQTGIKFHDARGGQTQFRVVGELPAEVSHEARLRIVRGFAEPFAEQNLPYMIVMHAPDHSNNDNNWHFHLIYHDRPVARFVNDLHDPMHDHLRPCTSDGDRKRASKAKALAQIGLPHMEQFVGRWNFDVPLHTKTKSRNTKTSFPFGQTKLRGASIFDPAHQRVRLAELTNIELERARANRRVDPRTFEQMGIDREPDEHLSSSRSQLEERGIPTAVGQQNEDRQWRYRIGHLEAAYAKAAQELEAETLQLRRMLAARKPKDEVAETGTSLIRAYEHCKAAALEHDHIARMLAEQYDRTASRAKKVEQVCIKHLSAIEAGKASKRLRKEEQAYRDRLDEARAHLAGSNILLGDELAQIDRSQVVAARYEAEANRLRAEFGQVLDRAMEEAAAAAVPQQESDRPSVLPVDALQPGAQEDRQHRSSNNNTSPPKRMLTTEGMDAFIKYVLDQNIRLVLRDRVVVPKVEDPRIAEIVAAANYHELMPRLTVIHAKQNQARDDLLKAIEDNPALVQVRRREDGCEAVALQSPDKRLQAALRMHIDDPQVRKALSSILSADANSSNSDSSSTDSNITAAAPVIEQRGADAAGPASPVQPSSQPSEKPAEHFDLEAERERIRAAKFGQPRVQELRNGLHPLIDQWLEAKAKGEDAGQQAAAEAIASDPAARSRLKPLSGPDVDALRFDLAAAEEKARRKEEAERKLQQQQLALNLQRSKGVGWS